MRNIILFAALLLLIWKFFLPLDSADSLLSTFDKRPAVHVLFLGNSRTFYNDMPFMVPKIADSAHSPIQYQVTMYAKPNLRLEDLWKSSDVQDLLARKWDYIVIQGASSEQIGEVDIHSFLAYGAMLISTAKQAGSNPVLLVAWRCADSYYPQLATMGGKPFYERIQRSYLGLANETGIPAINVGRVFEQLASTGTESLTSDGNHPTQRASYLIALMFYRFFSHDDLAHVTWAPPHVSAKDAAFLRAAASQDFVIILPQNQNLP